MAIPAGKVADLKTTVYEQVELGLVLQVEGTQGSCGIQAVQSVLLGKKARLAVAAQPDGKVYIRQCHIGHVIDAAEQVQIHQMGVVILTGSGMQFGISLPFDHQQVQIRLFGQAALDQLPDDIHLVVDDRSDRIRKVYLRLVEQAEQVLFRHGTFQLVLFHTDTVVRPIRVDSCLLLRYFVGTPA